MVACSHLDSLNNDVSNHRGIPLIKGVKKTLFTIKALYSSPHENMMQYFGNWESCIPKTVGLFSISDTPKSGYKAKIIDQSKGSGQQTRTEEHEPEIEVCDLGYKHNAHLSTARAEFWVLFKLVLIQEIWSLICNLKHDTATLYLLHFDYKW